MYWLQLILIVNLVNVILFRAFQIFEHSFVIFCTTCLCI